MNTELSESIARVKELLQTVRNAAMATVNEDGSPHNTPFHYSIDETREHIYAASSPEAQHSRNLARTGQAFIVIYDPSAPNGLYMQAENAHELSGSELQQGLEVWNAQRAREGRPPLDRSLFSDESPQRMYRFDIVGYATNHSERNAAGIIVRDIRVPIHREDLLA